MAAEFPAGATGLSATPAANGTFTPKPISAVDPLYIIIDSEGLNKNDECAVGASKSGFPDGYFAKIPTTAVTYTVFYNDNAQQENISTYYPPIGRLDRIRIRTRSHSQKASGESIFWQDGEYSLSLELECMENAFDSFSSLETRISDRA